MARKSFDSRAIANEILEFAWKRGHKLTKMQLIKLVFLAHGWSLAFFDRPIVKEAPEAWKMGPVYPKLYSALSGYTSQPVNRLIEEEFSEVPYRAASLSNGERELIDTVERSYGKMHAFDLSSLTHKAGSPWASTMATTGTYSDIDEELMTKYYDEVRRKNGYPKDRFDF